MSRPIVAVFVRNLNRADPIIVNRPRSKWLSGFLRAGQTLSMIVALLLITACQTRLQVYEGRELPDSDVATVRVGSEQNCTLWIWQANGKSPDYPFVIPNRHKMSWRLLPGDNLVYVRVTVQDIEPVPLLPDMPRGCRGLPDEALPDYQPVTALFGSVPEQQFYCGLIDFNFETGRSYQILAEPPGLVLIDDSTSHVVASTALKREPYQLKVYLTGITRKMELEPGKGERDGCYLMHQSVQPSSEPGKKKAMIGSSPDAATASATENYDGLWVADHGSWTAELQITNGRYRLEVWCNSSKRVGGLATGTLEEGGRIPLTLLGHNVYQTTASGRFPEIEVTTSRNYYCSRAKLNFERAS